MLKYLVKVSPVADEAAGGGGGGGGAVGPPRGPPEAGAVLFPPSFGEGLRRESLVNEARTLLKEKLGLGPRAAGRPTFDRLHREEMLEVLLAQFKQYNDENGGTLDDWWPGEAKEVYENNNWILHLDMKKSAADIEAEILAGGILEHDGDGGVLGHVEPGAPAALVAALAAGGGGGDGTRASPQPASLTVQYIYRALAHQWDKDGNHMGWYGGDVLAKRIHDQLGHVIGRATAFRYREVEKELYEKKNGGIRKKPDFVQLINSVVTADKESKVLTPEEEPDKGHFKGRPVEFQPEWYPMLAKRCEDLQKLLGFGPHIVQAFASVVYAEKMKVDVEDAWIPSDNWCYWFMHKIMGLTPRRITSHAHTLKEQEEHARFKKITLQRLAIKISQGLKIKHISGSDEFALHLFQQAKWKWEKKGAKKVESLLKQDRRQITGDYATNAAGQVIAVHLIFDGKTDRALPSPKLMNDAKYDRFKFARTLNHWADHPTKCAFMDKIYKWHLTETAKDNGVELHEAKQLVNVVHFLDCWPVNLAPRFREYVATNCPGLEIFWIPAGFTGEDQVNDTDLHKPAKDVKMRAANEWYLSKYSSFRRELDAGIIDVPAFDGRVAALMGKNVLRQMVPVWVLAAVEHIQRPLPGGGNIISNGWNRIYIEPATDADFLREALEERSRRQAAAVSKAKAAALVAKKAEIEKQVKEVVDAARAAGGKSEGELLRLQLDTTLELGMAAADDQGGAVVEEEDVWGAHEAAAAVAADEAVFHAAQVPKIHAGPKPKPGAPKKPRLPHPDERAVGAALGRALLGVEEEGGEGGDAAEAAGGGDAALEDEPACPLGKLSHAQLQEQCVARKLSKTGTKPVLIARIVADDARATAAAEGGAGDDGAFSAASLNPAFSFTSFDNLALTSPPPPSPPIRRPRSPRRREAEARGGGARRGGARGGARGGRRGGRGGGRAAPPDREGPRSPLEGIRGRGDAGEEGRTPQAEQGGGEDRGDQSNGGAVWLHRQARKVDQGER